jgi:hypothetical protein
MWVVVGPGNTFLQPLNPLVIVVLYHYETIECDWRTLFHQPLLSILPLMASLAEPKLDTMMCSTVKIKFSLQNMDGMKNLIVIFIFLVKGLTN